MQNNEYNYGQRQQRIYQGTPTYPRSQTTQGSPTTPRAPTTPRMPTTPGAPTMPGMPTTPGAPTTPGMPTTPGAPTMPGMPTTPGAPTMPGMPTTPGAPTTPGMPTTPGAPMLNNTTYPEVYYKVLPYIYLACDQLDSNNIVPNQEMLDEISDNIYNDVLVMYPEIEKYAKGLDTGENNTAVQLLRRSPSYYGRRFRRRGLFRDLIDILLMSEFNRRRRRYY